jgi:putative alpha-1,2-mannosidase
VAEFDRPFASSGTWDAKGATDETKQRSGAHTGAYVGFKTHDGDAVSVRVGTSLISLEQAERNLKTEMPRADPDAVAEAARRVWDGCGSHSGHFATIVLK